MTSSYPSIDPKLDLVLERTIDVPRERVWKAWTTPEHLMRWFTPAPWKTVECQIDLRPGGRFFTVMESPEGQRFPGQSCYLEVVPNERLVWTNGLLPGYRPIKKSVDADTSGISAFTAVILMEAHGAGTKYTAIALHIDESEREAHEKMGFHHGWGAALDQLVAMAHSI